MTKYTALDIAENWSRLNDTIVALVDYVPEDKLDWSPREDLWNFRGILAHIAFTRHHWLGNVVRDAEAFKDSDVFSNLRTSADVQQVIRESWDRVDRFLSDRAKLDASYQGSDGADDLLTGHWIAFHLLEHDIHHRSDIFHYLALLGNEHPDVGTP